MRAIARNVVYAVGLGLLIASVSFNAWSQPPGYKSTAVVGIPEADVNDAGAVSNSSASTANELQKMMQNQTIDELRTTYNGNYGATLLFKKEERVYYVVLFQQKKFWRVVKTTSNGQAEQTYKSFANQSEKLADIEIRRIRLEADKRYMEQQIAKQEGRLTALQNDLAIQQQQERTVVAQQNQAREQAQLLSDEQQAADRELRNLQSHIRVLEAQQMKLDDMDFNAVKPKRK